MSKISKPNFQSIWASGGAVAAVSSTKIIDGWIVEIPPYEEANFIENRQDKAIAHLFQMGIADWDNVTEYQVSSYTQYQGIIYQALIVNSNSQPDISPNAWRQSFADYNSFINHTNGNNPHPQYVLKDSPVMNAGCAGVGYQAQSNGPSMAGNSITGYYNLNNGYGFKNNWTGLFDLGKLALSYNNEVKAYVPDSTTPPISDNSLDIATHDWTHRVVNDATNTWNNNLTNAINGVNNNLNTAIAGINATIAGLVDLFYPVGIIISFNDANFDPNTKFPNTQWQRQGQGKIAIGYNTDPSSPAYQRQIGGTAGGTSITLADTNMPQHDHIISGAGGGAAGDKVIPCTGGQGTWSWDWNAVGYGSSTNNARWRSTPYGNPTPTPIDITPPVITEARWKRVA